MRVIGVLVFENSVDVIDLNKLLFRSIRRRLSTIIDRFLEAGGTHLDTANVYVAGLSEKAVGKALAVLFALWLLARLLSTDGTNYTPYAAAAELAFLTGLLVALSRAFLQVRQQRQAPVIALLGLFIVADVLFWLGAAGWLTDGARLGVYGGLYVALGMVLYMGRRVIPFFTARGVGYEVHLRMERWVDFGMTGLFPLFMLSELLLPLHPLGAGLAAVQPLPTPELSALSIRSGGLSYREAVAFSLRPLPRLVHAA